LIASENVLLALPLGLLETNADAMMYMSGTSMASPVVAGAAALLLQDNPNLTPGMVKVILEYSAQPISGANMLEQGAGQLNVEGAIRLANSMRTDMDFQTAAKGTSLFSTGSTAPTPSTTIGGYTFPWSQLVLTNQSYVTGQNLISQFQPVYKRENVLSDGVLVG